MLLLQTTRAQSAMEEMIGPGVLVADMRGAVNTWMVLQSQFPVCALDV